eukprot:gnl/MRDRNA2_/MRDRNA2_38001_c0_seq1.p1 gnl/MRDRNA2_/MRDRNA2_38001_c0~~gnl/MRDRNA2_/MRDRNA2_38001_c0_seq1.p1  ORF type:complete len:135 (+),score=13.89 gnl/MRDRNA2_/MRDRNA2_38001_c0_seq1:2-406(+)
MDFHLDPRSYVTQVRMNGEDHCQLGIRPQDNPLDDFVLGIPFLRTYYTIWDAEQRRVGLATAKTSVNNPVSKAWTAGKRQVGFSTAQALLSNADSDEHNNIFCRLVAISLGFVFCFIAHHQRQSRTPVSRPLLD